VLIQIWDNAVMKIKHLLVIAICMTLGACASVVRNPLPEADHENVTLLGSSDLRQWGDGNERLKMRWLDDRDRMEERFAGIMHREHHYLVISGGGANGAYGAGVLKAWSELGTRPEFIIVTGVSTGALTAPFAFLGSEYDARLEEVYTTLDTRKILNTRSIFTLFGADSMVDTSPLSRSIEEFIDDGMIEAMAVEYRRGRTLLIGTTNLDAARPVIWNITRIAATGHPDAGKLIRQVLLASASIPGAFPPVYIEVETPDGRKFDEMHVDGGVTSQMFFYPANVDWQDVTQALDVKGQPTIHLVRNAYITPEYEIVNPRLLPIAERTINSLIRTQGIGDFFRIGTLAERDELGFSVTWIPEETRDLVGVIPAEAFDPNYMKALFEFGYERAQKGEAWLNFYDLIDLEN
jgi:predicted acylesterase/phospholipase RssA